MIFAPRSCPSKPGLATKIRSFLSGMRSVLSLFHPKSLADSPDDREHDQPDQDRQEQGNRRTWAGRLLLARAERKRLAADYPRSRLQRIIACRVDEGE